MAKREYNFEVGLLALFIILVPMVGSGFDDIAVIYSSFCLALAAFMYGIYKNGRFFVTKTTVVLALIAAFAYAGVFFVSDKGNHTALATIFLTSTLCSMLPLELKKKMSEEGFKDGVIKCVYLGSIVYGVCAVLYQIFIESTLFGSNMDIGSGSPTAAAMISVAGIWACIKLFENRKKTIAYYLVLLLLGYVFLMSKSLAAYLAVSVMLFVYIMGIKNKKVEAFFALLLVIVVAVFNGIYVVFSIVTASVPFEGMFRGLAAVMGIGAGGYNAAVSVMDKGYTTLPPSYALLTEAFGIVGIAIVCLVIGATFVCYEKNRDKKRLFMLLAAIVIMLTSSEALCFMLPLMAMYCSLHDEEREIKLSGGLAFVLTVPLLLGALFTFARIPHGMGKDNLDMGKYEEAAACYNIGASMELFSSEGWEMAYKAALKAYENGAENVYEQREYIENAIKFNKKNYKYLTYLSDTYTREGDCEKALEIWEKVIDRYDREYLYPEYARKICDVMKKGEVPLTKMEELYNTLSEYALRAEDGEIKLKVNDILTESQRYYIASREGKTLYEEEYVYEEETEPVSEETT